MKKLLWVLLLAAASFAAAQDLDCRVVGISDGDTLTCLLPGSREIKVRLDQIDAPEHGQPFAQAAKRRLSALAYGKQVRLKTDGIGKYGRTLAEVFADGRNINKEMVRGGYAWAYRQYVRDREYLLLEEQARRASLGLWSEPNPVYLSEYRHHRHDGEVTAQIQPPHIPQPSRSGGFTCVGKRFCREMTSCAEARFYLTQCGVRRLDGDHDGIPCESLC